MKAVAVVRRRAYLSLISLTLFSIFYVLGSLVGSRTSPVIAGDVVVSNHPLDGPSELRLYVFVSERCLASRREELRAAIASIRNRLLAIAGAEGLAVVTVGVSLDGDTREGLRALRRLGPFEEVSAGSGWANEIAFRYILSAFPGPEVIPQVVLVRRDPPQSNNPGTSARETLLWRAVGLAEIVRWGSTGLPVLTVKH